MTFVPGATTFCALTAVDEVRSSPRYPMMPGTFAQSLFAVIRSTFDQSCENGIVCGVVSACAMEAAVRRTAATVQEISLITSPDALRGPRGRNRAHASRW